jgi:putative membrane protein
MNIATIFYFHKQWNLKSISIFIFIIILSFAIEMIGVSSGKIFGNYIYDKGLGLKLMNTPLIIGLNWLFLVYASQSIVGNYFKNAWYRILLSTSLMLIYDIIMEWVAPSMQMWHFTTPYPPKENFISWFILALVFQILIVAAKIKTNNYPARMLFWIQMVFFIIIGIIESY